MKTGLIECNICLVYILEPLYVYTAGFVLGYCILVKLRELSFCDIDGIQTFSHLHQVYLNRISHYHTMMYISFFNSSAKEDHEILILYHFRPCYL